MRRGVGTLGFLAVSTLSIAAAAPYQDTILERVKNVYGELVGTLNTRKDAEPMALEKRDVDSEVVIKKKVSERETKEIDGRENYQDSDNNAKHQNDNGTSRKKVASGLEKKTRTIDREDIQNNKSRIGNTVGNYPNGSDSNDIIVVDYTGGYLSGTWVTDNPCRENIVRAYLPAQNGGNIIVHENRDGILITREYFSDGFNGNVIEFEVSEINWNEPLNRQLEISYTGTDQVGVWNEILIEEDIFGKISKSHLGATPLILVDADVFEEKIKRWSYGQSMDGYSPFEY